MILKNRYAKLAKWDNKQSATLLNYPSRGWLLISLIIFFISPMSFFLFFIAIKYFFQADYIKFITYISSSLLSFALCLLIIYFLIYKPFKHYENRYGKTGFGDKFLRPKNKISSLRATIQSLVKRNKNPITPIPIRRIPKASRNGTPGKNPKYCKTRIIIPTIIIVHSHVITTFFNSCIAKVRSFFEFINLAFTKMGERLTEFSSCIAQRTIFRGFSQPSICGEERTIRGGNGNGKTQPNMDGAGGGISGRKL